ncbi:PREDICTED: uncharacterized protein LOC105360243 [Ceratosolen solmsi marchali]|uniref:Uncharacterized protein LOC105360243 n=1 Tax=Ceratosolen solmsi marchali TaxID=326594 RepID=A0AAJ6VNT0_9HYME|nr:PREDICTED: uncharacterized protein LOC105360243 [Ceratosolen solmsi marchali]
MCRRRLVHAALAILVLVVAIEARPPGATLSRPKRVSDQRLAEIETWLALSKMKGKLVTVPVGFGQVDPNKIGRRRRSSTESNLQELRRILRSVVEGDGELSPEDRTRYARLFSSRWYEKEQDQASGDRDDDDSIY